VKVTEVSEELFAFPIVRTLNKQAPKKLEQAEKLSTSIREVTGSHLGGTPAILTGF
jgi:hypothetical protein